MDLKELPPRSFQRHPWEIVRARFFARLVRENVAGNNLTALDVGAGDGYVAERLLADVPALAHVSCFDVGYGPRWLGETPHHPGMSFTAREPRGSHDLVLLLDVLEHVDDPHTILADVVARSLAPEGLVLVSVPAWNVLFSFHDRALGHKRRFSPIELHTLVRDCGLAIVRHGHLFSSLVLPRALMKLGELAVARRAASKEDRAVAETALASWHHGRAVTALVTFALGLDVAGTRLSSRLGIPTFGLSTWVLARRQ